MSLSFGTNAQTKRNVKQEEANKKLVMTFYQQLLGDKNIEAIDTFLAKDFISHNPFLLDGSEAMKSFFNPYFANATKTKVDFRNVAADGDLVFLHMKMTNPIGGYRAVADVFKVTNNKIVEMWDVVQPIPEKSENEHPMFDSLGVYKPAKRNVKQEEANKKLVLTFYQKLFGDKNTEAIDTYLSKDYKQHNPSVADGSEALKNAIKIWFEGAVKESVNIPHVASDGDLVFLHVKSTNSEGKTVAIMDIFRVTKNKITEHWDVIQEVPKNALNPHAMF